MECKYERTNLLRFTNINRDYVLFTWLFWYMFFFSKFSTKTLMRLLQEALPPPSGQFVSSASYLRLAVLGGSASRMYLQVSSNDPAIICTPAPPRTHIAYSRRWTRVFTTKQRFKHIPISTRLIEDLESCKFSFSWVF